MTDEKALVKRAEAFSKESGLALSTISTKIFDDGKRLGELKEGSRCWPETLERASKALDKVEADFRKASAQ
jgi:hypothetical protein